MKPHYLLYLAGCLSSASARAQHLQGAYYTVENERGFSSDLLQFSGNQFFYQHSGCLGTHTGEGTFKMEGGQLVLVFRKAKADTIVRVKAFASAPTTTPTFHFRVSTTDAGAGWLPGATVVAEGADWRPNAGATTDTAGRASFIYQPRPNDKLVVKSVGYDPVVIALRATTGQKFAVRLGPPYYFAAGDTLVFQLKSVRANSFAYRQRLDMLDIDDEKLPYSHSEKISEAAASKLIQDK